MGGEDLLIESVIGALELRGPHSVIISAARGNVSLTGHTGVTLQTHSTGKIVLDSPSIHLPRLPLAPITHSLPILALTMSSTRCVSVPLAVCSSPLLLPPAWLVLQSVVRLNLHLPTYQ